MPIYDLVMTQRHERLDPKPFTEALSMGTNISEHPKWIAEREWLNKLWNLWLQQQQEKKK